jgi:hypothetical protein
MQCATTLWYAIQSTGKLEGINKETICKTHLEIVEERNGKCNLRPAVIELCHVLS